MTRTRRNSRNWRLFLFLVFGARSEIIDIKVFRRAVLIIDPKDLACELFLERFFFAGGLEPLRTASRRFGVRAKILAGWAIAIAAGFCKIRCGRAHRRSRRPRSGRWTESAYHRPRSGSNGPGSGFSRASFVHGERPSLERLIVKFEDRLLGLLSVGEFHEGKPAFLSGLAIERNGHVREISYGGEVLTNFLFRGVVGKIPDK